MMMNNNIHETIVEFLQNENVELKNETGDELIRMIFRNARTDGLSWRGMRLTNHGLTIMSCYFESFKIKPKNITNSVIVYLDRVAKFPYYLDDEKIVVFEDNLGVRIILAEGDLELVMKMG